MDRSRLPAYARNMTSAEIYATNPHRFLMWCEFYVCLAVIVLVALYLPWGWIGQWALAQAFVSVMEQIVPSIAGLEAEYRYLSLDASKARLSFIHWIGGGLCIIRLITLPLPVYYEAPCWKLWIGAISYIGLVTPLMLWVFFWDGVFREEPGFWYGNNLAVVLSNLTLWSFITFGLSWAWGFTKELRRRHSEVIGDN